MGGWTAGGLTYIYTYMIQNIYIYIYILHYIYIYAQVCSEDLSTPAMLRNLGNLPVDGRMVSKAIDNDWDALLTGQFLMQSADILPSGNLT